MLDIPITKSEMTEVVLQTLQRNQLSDAYIRLVVSRGPGDLGLDREIAPNPPLYVLLIK